MLGQECGEGASIVDIYEEIPAEETTTEETLDAAEQLVTDQELSNEETLTAEQELITQESFTRKYPSREHQPPHRYDNYIPL